MDLAVEAGRRKRKLRILVTRLRFFGDVIISSPVVEEIKKRYPEAEVYYLSQPGYADTLKNHPAIAGIIELEGGAGGYIRTILLLRKLKFVAAIDLFYNPASAGILFLSDIPVRIGGKRRWREKLYTETVEVPPEILSAVDHNLYFLKKTDVDAAGSLPRIYLTEAEKEEGFLVVERLRRGPEKRERIVALHAGGTWPSKRWPPEKYALLIDHLKKELGAGCILVTGPGEEGIVDKVSQLAVEKVEILPHRPVREVASILDSCDAVVANDGGIMHLAVALGKPVTAVFGPTDPDIWFPYSGKGPFEVVTAGVNCAPCDLHDCDDMRCMETIGADDVIERLISVTGW
ncbi:MAG: glycosyltransferase family 9 protein [Candidatus Krumholzibacteriota bacterium]|nr:glycosyltransferase family 9 protein [Candidatus Krumholzibacteriota bacterium]